MSHLSELPAAGERRPRFAFSLSQWQLVLLGFAFAFLWFAPLNIRHLVPSDEGRYAEIAREMLSSGDWLAPHYNGYLYFEKPPLQAWLTATSFAGFGVGAWQARLYTALCGFLGVGCIGWTGARLFGPRVGLYAALSLGSAPYWNALGHFNTLDMGLAFWMEMSMCLLLLAQRPLLSPAVRRMQMWGCWAAMAMAVLSKGLVGVLLPGMVLALYAVSTRDWALWRRLHWFSGLLIFTGIAAPWFVLMQARYPAFFDFFFVTQQFRRYLTPEQHRPGAYYYFLPVIVLGFFPWISQLWPSVRRAWTLPAQSNGFRPTWLLLLWIACIFCFFSASHSKLISYVLPIAPAIALLLGFHLCTIQSDAWRRHLIGPIVLIGLASLGAGYLPRLGDVNTPATLYRAYQAWVYGSLAISAAGIALSAWLSRCRSPYAMGLSLIAYAMGWFWATSVAGLAHEIFGRIRSGIPLLPPVQAELQRGPPNLPFYAINRLDHTLPFYLQRTLILVQEPDELRFGAEQEPNKWIPTLDAWVGRWRQAPEALALMPPPLYTALAAKGVPMRIIAQDARRVIVAKPGRRCSGTLTPPNPEQLARNSFDQEAQANI